MGGSTSTIVTVTVSLMTVLEKPVLTPVAAKRKCSGVFSATSGAVKVAVLAAALLSAMADAPVTGAASAAAEATCVHCTVMVASSLGGSMVALPARVMVARLKPGGTVATTAPSSALRSAPAETVKPGKPRPVIGTSSTYASLTLVVCKSVTCKLKNRSTGSAGAVKVGARTAASLNATRLPASAARAAPVASATCVQA